MEEDKENVLVGYPNIISYECTKKIKEQMEKNICKINIGKSQGTGFFCKIPFPDLNNMLPVFITNNHIIDKELLYKNDIKIKIDIYDESDIKEIDLNNRIKYTNEEYDITIIEIKKEDKINNYLELDEIIINDIINNINKNKIYINETIYIIQYPENKLSVSYGLLENIYLDKNYNFNHKCSTKGGSSGSPILNINNIIIGIHKEGNYNNKQYNKGLFLNYPVKEFIQEFKQNKILLKNFINKYKLNIDDNENALILNNFNIGNEGLNELSNINFKELKFLVLEINNISDIKVLEKAKYEKLEELYLGRNKILDINILEKVNFKELKQLYLNNNNISDIKVLDKVNFKELKKLYLNNNNISDIKVLEKVKFENLEFLGLSEIKY